MKGLKSDALCAQQCGQSRSIVHTSYIESTIKQIPKQQGEQNSVTGYNKIDGMRM